MRRLELRRVTVHGYSTDVASLWETHHALLLTSRTEGLPLVVQEAMACGRVPIVTDAGGTAEIVEDGVDGFVARAAAVADIDDAMERAWARRADWPSIGLAGAARLERLRAERGDAPLADLVLAELDRPGLPRGVRARRAARLSRRRAPTRL